ncbi:Glyoxalase-like domain protein [Roseovarius sp. THAF9]|uniref:VOC family protein n=1 Tax=Roseovarius sp. THAF9 TaxID=2587847 RepID=UPI0012698103|nr:VOC family protein [Roseovarius sp. THAF9]QFT93514.1 Glyoxalase-like domain protein [Roseovarius sp. THAF9]
MPGIVDITPFVFTRDLAASCEFFESLGFAPGLVQPDLGYAYCTGHGHALRVLQVSPEAEIGEQMIYLDVDDIDAFYDELRPVLDDMPEARVRPPFNQDYGQREFHVKDPDNCLLLFGSRIMRATDIPGQRRN